METNEAKRAPEVCASIKKFVVKVFTNKRYDPVESLPKKALNKIFDYFGGDELLKLSLVNRRWYKFIGKSTQCMDRIKVVIAEPRAGNYPLFSTTDSFIMTQNGRKYMHISMAALERQFLTQHKLLLTNFQWKSVALYHHTFKTQMDLINFLGMIEPFVEELVLQNIRHGKSIYKICHSNFHFPRLMKLSIINCYTFIYSDPFRYVKTLRCLNLATDALPNYIIDSNEQVIERVRAIESIFLNNEYIGYLELFIHQNDFDAIFMDQRFLRRIRFNLRSFYVGKFKQEDGEGINIVQISNFVDFLKSQEHTLSTLYLENWLGNAALEYAINDMQLRGLTITNFESYGRHNDSIGNLSLFSNDTIEHLSIWTDTARDHFLAVEMLKVCRGLKALEIRTINQEILQILIEYAEDLQIIICDFFTAYMPPDRPVLKNLHTMIVNVTCADNFRDLIAYKERHTSFEFIFLKAAKQLQKRWNLSIMNNCRF